MAFDEGPGRHRRAQGRDLRARLRPARRRGRLPARGHHLRPQHLRRRHRHRGAQRLRRRLHRGDDAQIKESCPLRHTSPAASRTSRSPSAATIPCARRCTRCSSTTPSRPGMDMGIVNAGQLAVYDDIDPELRERVEDVMLNRRAPTPPSAARLRRDRFKGGKEEAADPDLSWRELGRRGAPRPTRWSTASPLHRSPTPRRPASSRPPARRDRGAADGRHERRRRPVRRRQDVPAAGGEVARVMKQAVAHLTPSSRRKSALGRAARPRARS
jgi:hypothetical protein